ncbi:hypothetical protein [Sulfurimicrobium lacus]|uniref:hypothetical protein n=1 Tax=Sulfurimicrobium lacus TaxID=2715678 RepID=UPI00156509C9|nr:hypothetical protein [Sulfurimicrobium lacus]
MNSGEKIAVSSRLPATAFITPGVSALQQTAGRVQANRNAPLGIFTLSSEAVFYVFFITAYHPNLSNDKRRM